MTAALPEPTGSRAAAWLDALRLEYQGDNLVAWFCASAVAATAGSLPLGWMVLGLAMLMTAQAAVELLDGYHDFVQGAHQQKAQGEQVWTGGSGVLAATRLTPSAVNRAAWTLGGIAAVLLSLTFIRTGRVGVVTSVVAVVASIGWAMPPLKLSYRGLGEFTVGVIAGPLLTLQAWLIAAGTFDARALWLGVPFGLLETAMALMHGICDREADAAVGKRTLVVRIGDRASALLHVAALVAAFGAIVGLVAVKILPLLALGSLLVIPLAVRSGRLALRVARDRRTLAEAMRAFPAYSIHALVGIILVVACVAALPLGDGLALLGGFAVCYAPVVVVLLRRQRARRADG